jgi:hypothetical protein
MNVLTKKWMECVFDAGEQVCISNSPYETRTQDMAAIGLELSQYITINPLRKGGYRKDTNVKRFRTLLFEIDELPIQEQIPLMKQSGLPYSTCLFSGNKSYHFLLVLKDELQDRTEYDAYWRAIAKALLDDNVPIDRATKNPSRFTRAPFAERDGVVQAVHEVNGRISLTEVDAWLKTKGIDAKRFIKPRTLNPNTQGYNVSADTKTKIEYVEKYFMKNMEYVQGNKNTWQFTFARCLKNTGISREEIHNIFLTYDKFEGVIDERDPIARAFSYENDEPIYVPTKSEQVSYDKDLKKQEKQHHIQSVNINISEDLEEYKESPNRYYRVGTDYFKWMPDTKLYLKWSRSIFEHDYGSDQKPPPENIFDGFQFEPDFKEPTKTCGTANKYINSFSLPKVVDTSKQLDTVHLNDFSNIIKVLRYGFADQVKLAIEYLAVSLQKPKQPLPAILFLGTEGDGKTALAQLLGRTVGDYFKNTDPKTFEGDYNSYLDQCLLLLINEVGAWKDSASVMNYIKELVTDKDLKFTVNGKYDKQKSINFYGKLIFTTNSTLPFKDIGEGTRFWVRRCQGARPKVDGGFWATIDNEMPYFVKYLLNYKLDESRLNVSDGDYRLYFKPDEFDNIFKQELKKQETETELYTDLLDVISEFFSNYPDQSECFMDLKSIKYKLQKNYKGINNEIKNCMSYSFLKRERTPLLDRPDSLYFDKSQQDIPIRKSQWWIFTKSDLDERDDLTRQMTEIMGK